MGWRYHNKRPPFKPDPRHWVRKSSNGWKSKVAYETEDDAWEFLQQNPRLKALGYRPYFCPLCSKYHRGHLHKQK